MINLSNKKIGVVIVAEDNYINNGFALITLKSFIDNNPWFTGDIIFFYDDVLNTISDINKQKLEYLYNNIVYIKSDYKSYKYIIEDGIKSKRILVDRYAHAYPKFEIFKLSEYDKILCIDGDTIINGNLEELFNMDIAVGGTSTLRYFWHDLPIDYENKNFEFYYQYWIDSDSFNSGVIYLGNKTFLNEKSYNRVIEILKDKIYDDIEFPITFFDQDIFKCFFIHENINDFVWLSPIYNVCIYNHQKPWLKWDDDYTDILDLSRKDIVTEKGKELINNAKIFHYLTKPDKFQSKESIIYKLYNKYNKEIIDIFQNNNTYYINKMKSCVIAFARNEESQLDEWINYHLDLGFTHIFILDNNDEDNKLIIYDNRVSVVPYHIDCNKIFNETGKNHSGTQVDAYNYIFSYVYDMGYEYAAIIDIDEFITLKQHINIDDFIQKEMIDKNINLCEILWEIYDDNGIIWEKDCKSSIRETYTSIQTRKSESEMYMFDLFNWPKVY